MQTKQITIDDEESQLKVEILRSLVNQMLQSQTLKGFRTWKDATIYKNEQIKYNKSKGREIIISRLKANFFKSLFKAFQQWKQQNTPNQMKQDYNQSSFAKQIKLFKICQKQYTYSLRRGFNTLKNLDNKKKYNSSAQESHALLKIVQRQITLDQIKMMKAFLSWKQQQTPYYTNSSNETVINKKEIQKNNIYQLMGSSSRTPSNLRYL
eukprot:403330641